MKTWQLLVLVGIIIVGGIGAMLFLRNTDKSTNTKSNSESKETVTEEKNTNQSNSNTAKSSEGCSRSVNKEAMNEAIDIKNKFVTLNVEGYGDIKVELYDEDAPKAVENFLRLTQSGYYDCVTFHRISKGFVIQGGDPTGTGSGGDTASGKPLMDELDRNTPSGKAGYLKGVLAMAKTQAPNSATSQFFIMLDNNMTLPYDYTIFGKVVSGIDAVDKIGQVEIVPQMSPNDGAPKEKITITKATISSN